MNLDQWAAAAELQDLSVTTDEVAEFLRSRVWLAIRVGVARTLSQAYSVLKDRKRPELDIRHAQGMIEGLEWLFKAAEAVPIVAQREDAPLDSASLERRMRELLDGSQN